METPIQSLKTLSAEQWHLAGGKAATLARLAQAGYPVPDGFVILPTAFAGEELLPEAWKQVQAHVLYMRTGNPAITFAVRSSALHEDSAQASFAGAFETVLDVRTDQAIREAIHTLRTSQHNAHVQVYSQAHRLTTANDIAVVVQLIVQSELSGVLFTADPITGSYTNMIGNFVYGLGEQLVSGQSNAHFFKFMRPKGKYDGPNEFKKYASQLYKFALKLETQFDVPQDSQLPQGFRQGACV